MRRKARSTVKLTLFAVMLLAVAASAQDYKIRAKVDLVEVPVTVKGPNGKLITGLTKNDFLVLEDGRPQTILNFTIDPVPLSAAVIVDTGLAPASLSKIQQTFVALTGSFSQFDEVAVYRYDRFVTQVLDFSASPEHFETAMQTIRNVKSTDGFAANLPPDGPFSVPGPVINGAPVVLPGQVGVFVTTPPRPSKVLNDAIYTAASDLANRERNRRRIVLIISDGLNSGNDHTFDETTQSLLAKGVQVYAIGVDQPFPYKKFSVLEDYAKTTGGDVFFVNSIRNIEAAYASATEQARNQYVIGYVSNNEVTGPGPVFREISVEIVGRNLKTIYRKGYYQYP
jgi:VWFA-related protein